MGGFTDEQVAASFKRAFKEQSKAHPNYGKAVDLGSRRWWTNVRFNTLVFLHYGITQCRRSIADCVFDYRSLKGLSDLWYPQRTRNF